MQIVSCQNSASNFNMFISKSQSQESEYGRERNYSRQLSSSLRCNFRLQIRNRKVQQLFRTSRLNYLLQDLMMSSSGITNYNMDNMVIPKNTCEMLAKTQIAPDSILISNLSSILTINSKHALHYQWFVILNLLCAANLSTLANLFVRQQGVFCHVVNQLWRNRSNYGLVLIGIDLLYKVLPYLNLHQDENLYTLSALVQIGKMYDNKHHLCSRVIKIVQYMLTSNIRCNGILPDLISWQPSSMQTRAQILKLSLKYHKNQTPSNIQNQRMVQYYLGCLKSKIVDKSNKIVITIQLAKIMQSSCQLRQTNKIFEHYVQIVNSNPESYIIQFLTKFVMNFKDVVLNEQQKIMESPKLVQLLQEIRSKDIKFCYQNIQLLRKIFLLTQDRPNMKNKLINLNIIDILEEGIHNFGKFKLIVKAMKQFRSWIISSSQQKQSEQ